MYVLYIKCIGDGSNLELIISYESLLHVLPTYSVYTYNFDYSNWYFWSN